MSERRKPGKRHPRYSLAAWTVCLAAFLIVIGLAFLRAPAPQAPGQKDRTAAVFDPGYIMGKLPARSEGNDTIPPFGEKSRYTLAAYGLQGFYQSSDSALPWSIELPETKLEAQLVKRGPEPEVVTENITISWELAPDKWTDNGNVELPALRGDFVRAEGQNHFTADLAISVGALRAESFNPYQLVKITAKDGHGKILAESAACLALSPGFGCAHCHADPGFGILELHDRRNGTSLAADAKNGVKAGCKNCHMPIMVTDDGKYESGGLMDFSATIHAWHAPYLAGRGADACLSCHIGLGSVPDAGSPPQALFLRDLHRERGLDCVNCHGHMEDHSLALLEAEKLAGQPLADKFTAIIKTRRPEGAGKIVPRRAWAQLPDCTSCHDFSQKPPFDASAFGKWTGTKDGEAEPFSRRRDFSDVVRCATCHGAPHAVYPAQNPLWPVRDNIPPLQYQRAARPLGGGGNCAVCHAQPMDMPIHHPLVEEQ